MTQPWSVPDLFLLECGLLLFLFFQAQIDSLTDTINRLEIDVQKAQEDESMLNEVREKYEGEMGRMRSLLEGDLKTVEESSKNELQKKQEVFEEVG
jgi:hypothetical protein